jgi:hypothetical protein
MEMNLMNFETPVLMYDNLCTSCTKFAKFADFLTSHRILIIGMYPDKENINTYHLLSKKLPDFYKMSWLLLDGKAYGGRAGLLRLIKYFLLEGDGSIHDNKFDLKKCTTDCSTIKGVWLRSMSILTRSEKVSIEALSNK